jgi:excisionase family DNA binding protein
MKHHEPSAAMSIPAAAQYLALSRSGIYRLIKNGSLPRLKVGGRSLIRRADADALLELSIEAAVSTRPERSRRNSAFQADIFG